MRIAAFHSVTATDDWERALISGDGSDLWYEPDDDDHVATHNAGAIFNVDVCGGLPALVAALLLASSPGHLTLLPALPAAWPSAGESPDRPPDRAGPTSDRRRPRDRLGSAGCTDAPASHRWRQRPTMVTLADVARRAGVSASTVSYVLSGKRTISAETRRNVQSAIDALGHHPNAGARALASRGPTSSLSWCHCGRACTYR